MGEGLAGAAAVFPGAAVVVVTEVADDDAAGGGGVEETVGFEVDAYVVDAAAATGGGVEEEEVAGLEGAFADAAAVVAGDVLRAAGEGAAVDAAVDVADEGGAVDAVAGGATVAVGGAEPGCGFGVEGDVVAFADGDAELAGELFALGCAGAGEAGGCAAGCEEEGGKESREKVQSFHLFFSNM